MHILLLIMPHSKNSTNKNPKNKCKFNQVLTMDLYVKHKNTMNMGSTSRKFHSRDL